MSGTIIQLNEGVIKQELKELVRSSVEEALNKLLEQEASELLKVSRGFAYLVFISPILTANGQI